MRINHNISALNTYSRLSAATTSQSKSLEKLSSGLRINKASDDAAGLAISEKMRGQIRGLDQAGRNAEDGISLIQTAEGALNETHSILQRMRELAVQASNDTLTSSDRDQVQKEVDQLVEEIDRIANTTEFNKSKLLDGSLSEATTAQGTKLLASKLNSDSSGTAAASATTLIGLYDASNNALGVVSTDDIIVTAKVGNTYVSGKLDVVAADDVSDLMVKISSVLNLSTGGSVNLSGGQIVVTGKNGETNSIGGLTITVKDSSGNVKTGATNYLSSVTKTQDAADAHSDTSASLQIGANNGQTMKIGISKMGSVALGVDGLDVSNAGVAGVSISAVDEAIEEVSTQRAELGAFQNRLEHTINNLGTASENLTASESRIRDVDMAKEMMEFTKNNILNQAATAMLAQANQMPQGVLQLLG